jgi:predicted NUDIX family NTP pyrophosphohydrolase
MVARETAPGRRKTSAGLLLFRTRAGRLEVLLVHPGGPFWAGKDLGSWSIPKGELSGDEDPLEAALREFAEELGRPPAFAGELIALGTVRQAGGKIVHAWAGLSDFNISELKSAMFTLEWPPGSRREQTFPEVDRAAWLTIDEARRKILKGQVALLDELENRLSGDVDDGVV